MSVSMEDRADLLHRRIELYRRYAREGADLPVAAAPLRGCRHRLDHPMFGGDGYWIRYDPVFSERMPKAKTGESARQGSHHGRDHAP
jgi:hypothetical protein